LEKFLFKVNFFPTIKIKFLAGIRRISVKKETVSQHFVPGIEQSILGKQNV
jgi:hypothetical protein